MSDIAQIIAELIRAGVDPDLVGRTAAALAGRQPVVVPIKDAAAERKRAADRERQRENRATSRDVALQENTPTPPKESPPKPPKGGISPQAELMVVLDEERAAAVVEHRRRLRKPLTPRAAKLLGVKLAQAPDPNAAADLMVERGWQGFELSWASQPEKSAPAAEDEALWTRRLRLARASREWAEHEWGPPPGTERCRVPRALLQPNDGLGWKRVEQA